VEQFWRDLRFAWRSAIQNPSYSLLIIAVLAIGIGANTAIFGLANAAFFRALPYPHAERLAFLWQNNSRTGESEGAVSYPNYADWRAQARNFEDMAFVMFATEILNGSGTAELMNGPNGPERIPAVLVSTNFFSVLGVNPILGRAFTAGDALRRKANVVIISYSLWKSRFAGNMRAIGQHLDPDDSNGDIIVGVMPPDFTFPLGAQIWRPRELPKAMNFDYRVYRNMGVIGRLNAGVTWTQAQSEMDTIAARLAAQYPKDDSDIGIRIVPLRKQLSQKVSQGLLVLWSAIFCVLLIACVNVANLMMARAAGRQKEIAVRFSLGATRGRIIRQFLAESLLLAGAGGAVGLFLAYWTVAIVSKFNPDIARLGGGVFDGGVLVYAVVVAGFTALICGVLPAFSTSRLDLSRMLKETGSGSASRETQLIRKALIVAEVSLAFVLLAGSGLLIRSLWQIFSVNPGFDAENVYSLRIYSPPTKDTTAEANTRFAEIINRFRALPGVIAVGSTSNVLFPDEMFKGTFVIKGRENSPGQNLSLTTGDATPDLFRAMGIPLLRGRVFTDADAAQNAQPAAIQAAQDEHPAAIINETMARRYWPNEDPIGKQFKFGDPNLPQPWQTIVGVVGNVRQEGPEKSVTPMAYEASAGYYRDDIVVRARGDAKTLFDDIKAQVATVDKNSFVDHFEAVSEILSAHESQRKFNAWLLGVFAFIALTLAAVGIYGSVSYWVKQRTQEIGVRMALGAQPRNILTLVFRSSMSLIFIGLVLGVGGALAFTRLISAMLFGVRPEDPLTYTFVALLLANVAIAACWIPARRATEVDPLVALRHE
jgi:putative ABC transport system permease protein